MVKIKSITAIISATIAIGAIGCGGGGGTPTGPSTAPPRCNGQAATSNTRAIPIGARDNSSGCLFRIDSVRADSESEAAACEQATLNQQGLNASPVSSGTLQTFVFAFYLQGSCIGTTQVIDTSASSAMTCVKFSCTNCVVNDITASVVLSDGSIDLSTLSNWCTTHPTP
jgi:hypothetical protein